MVYTSLGLEIPAQRHYEPQRQHASDGNTTIGHPNVQKNRIFQLDDIQNKDFDLPISTLVGPSKATENIQGVPTSSENTRICWCATLQIEKYTEKKKKLGRQDRDKRLEMYLDRGVNEIKGILDALFA